MSDEAPDTAVEPTCPHCRGDIAAVIKRVEGAVWRIARQSYEAKHARRAARVDVNELAERVDQLERATVALLNRFTGQTAPVSSGEGDTK